MVRFEIYRNRAGQWQWRLVAANNEIVCYGEGYTTIENAKQSIQWIKVWAPSAQVREI